MKVVRAMAMGPAIRLERESRNPFFLWILACTSLGHAATAYFPFRGGASWLVGLPNATVGPLLVRLFEAEARRGAALELA